MTSGRRPVSQRRNAWIHTSGRSPGVQTDKSKMKIIIVSLTALAALALAPVASMASDKEVQNTKCPKACYKKSQQVALFVSGRGVSDQPAPPFDKVSKAQVGQGVGVTFFTGNR
jgi:hypothetical protein